MGPVVGVLGAVVDVGDGAVVDGVVVEEGEGAGAGFAVVGAGFDVGAAPADELRTATPKTALPRATTTDATRAGHERPGPPGRLH